MPRGLAFLPSQLAALPAAPPGPEPFVAAALRGGMLQRSAVHDVMLALVSPENVARQARAARKGASTRRVNEMPGNADTENRRSEVAACSSRGAERPHQQARASAGACGSSGRCARTPCRGQVRECVGDAQGASAHRVNEAPEDNDAKDRSFKAGIYVRAVGCARTPCCG